MYIIVSDIVITPHFVRNIMINIMLSPPPPPHPRPVKFNHPLNFAKSHQGNTHPV